VRLSLHNELTGPVEELRPAAPPACAVPWDSSLIEDRPRSSAGMLSAALSKKLWPTSATRSARPLDEVRAAVTIAQEAVLANAVRSWWQHVQEKAPDEFRGTELQRLLGL
jgi:hypothetical protein